jgi:hypothetical protein
MTGPAGEVLQPTVLAKTDGLSGGETRFNIAYQNPAASVGL